MKNIKNLKNGVFVLAAILLINIMACDITGLQDSVDDFALVIALEEINTGSSVLLTDAATGELVNATVSVTFEGENGTDVIDMFSDPIEGVDVEEGIFAFGINNSVVPTQQNPATIKLRLEADGYMTTIKTVELTDTGINDFAFTMVNENNKPESIKDISSSVVTNADGSLTSNLEVVSGDTTTSEYSTAIYIPEGTIFEDENGNTLTGNIIAEMTYYDQTETSALGNLPFDTDLIESESDSLTILLGVSTITVTDGQGKVASKMYALQKGKLNEQPGIEFSTRFRGGVDLSSEQNFKVDIFSDGTPTRVSSSAVCEAPPTGCKITYVVPFDLGKEKKKASAGVPVSPAVSVTVPPPIGEEQPVTKSYETIRIIHNGYTGKITYNNSYEGKVADTPVSEQLTEGATVTTLIGRANDQSKVKTFLKGSDKNKFVITAPVEFTYTLSNPLPSGNILTIDLPQKPATILDSSVVNIELRCSDPDEKLSLTTIPLTSVYYRRIGDNSWRRASQPNWNYDEEEQELKGGSVTVQNVQEGAEYELWFITDGKSEKLNVTITGTEVNVTVSERIESYCS